MDIQDIFSYIISEEANYQSRGVMVAEGWEWKMYDHIRRSILYKNSQLESGNPDGMKPVKNIIRPILNVAYRSEGFDVKDITLFVDDPMYFYKSFLTRKYHQKWARKNDIDTFIDELVESYCDFGGVLVKFIGSPRPEVVPMQRIAFCDQTDIVSGVICEKHPYTTDQLKEKTAWNQDAINDAIDVAVAEKRTGKLDTISNKVPQKYIEVYEVHGMMPTRWLSKNADDDYATADEHDYTRQAHYICFASKEQRDKKIGITLWKGPEKKDRYKLLKRDAIYGRALGFGGIEELFEAQVWTTYSMIQIKEMLDAAATMILTTSDQAFAQNNKVNELDKNDILVIAEGKSISQLNLQPFNIPEFEKSIAAWEQHAKITGSASDSALAVRPASGTPFALEALNVQNGLEMHQFRQGKIATFVGEIYRDWILPYIAKQLVQGDTWLDDLSLEEMEWVGEQVANNALTEKVMTAFRTKGAMIPNQEEADLFKQNMIQDFKKSGNKKFLEIFEGEMKSIPMDVDVNIVGKQRDLAKNTEKLNNIFRQVFANPQVLANPAMAKIFNEILESAGLSPADFSGLSMQQTPQVKTAAVEPQANVPEPVA